MNTIQIERIGKLIANGTDISVIANSFGIDKDVLRQSEDIRQSVADAMLESKEQEVDTDLSLRRLKEVAIQELHNQINSCSPTELTGVLATIAKVAATEKDSGLERARSGDTVNIQINSVSAPRLQLSPQREIISINDRSIVPATGDQLNAIIKREESSDAEAMGESSC